MVSKKEKIKRHTEVALKCRSMPLIELILEPACRLEFCGGTFDQCRGLCSVSCLDFKGHFRENEIEERFTEEEKEEVASLWNNKTGFYSDKGCCLPRNLRSEACLRSLCRFNEKERYL